MKKLIMILIVFIALENTGYTQSYFSHEKNKFLIGYEVAIPAGDLLSKTTWRGGRVEYRNMIKPNLSLGIGLSWNSFDEYVPRTTYQKPDGTGAVTTDLVKYVYTVPITASIHYYFNPTKKLFPYAGLGLGTQYADQLLYYNIFQSEEINWGFVARPELGLIYSFTDQTGMFLSGAYNYSTNKNDAFNLDHLAHFAITIGFMFGAR